MFTLAASAAYSADESGFPFLQLPIDSKTGTLVDAVWARWLEHDPLRRVQACEEALRSMSLVFLDAGNRDEHGLQFGARMLRDALRAIGAKVEHEEFDGGHRGTSWRYEASLPKLISALAME